VPHRATPCYTASRLRRLNFSHQPIQVQTKAKAKTKTKTPGLVGDVFALMDNMAEFRAKAGRLDNLDTWTSLPLPTPSPPCPPSIKSIITLQASQDGLLVLFRAESRLLSTVTRHQRQTESTETTETTETVLNDRHLVFEYSVSTLSQCLCGRCCSL
jgi:hypothetical protein